ncbi:unnamed protein product [Ambrosiozyma monospora]|uniref:Unnamed protein product n=1 Tax=Ambrosiozyma monospora TaxID=43982 RepID=A0A9W6Z275_AMBMO|nr:unnamed protein product [Ambrosiozyma monospora]
MPTFSSREEEAAEKHALMTGGLRGLALGGLISGTIFALSPRYYPSLLRMTNSVKTAIVVTPPMFLGLTNSQLSSNAFKESLHSSDFVKQRLLEEHSEWAKMSTSERMANEFELHKYQIITGMWAASMYGSWWYVNRDKLLTKAQKFVQARMYAQVITIGILFGAMGLTMYEQSHHLISEKVSEEDEYLQQAIAEGEAEEKWKKDHPNSK